MENDILAIGDYCRCGKPLHPCYGSRCEDCYAESMENAIGHATYRPEHSIGYLMTGTEMTGGDVVSPMLAHEWR